MLRLESLRDVFKYRRDALLMLETEDVLPLIYNALENKKPEELAGLLYLTANNPVIFSEIFCKLPKIDAAIKLNKAQKALMRAFYRNHYVYTIGSRQVGKSTCLDLLAIQTMAHYTSYPVAFVTLTEKQATDNYNDIRGIAENLPKLWPQIGKPTRGRRITLTNNSYTLVIPLQNTTDISGRIKGLSPYMLIVDEFPDLKRNKKVLSEGIPSLQTRFLLAKQKDYPYGVILAGNAVELGTEHALFAYRLWMQTINNKTNYVPIVFYYRDLLPPDEADKIIQNARASGLTERQILIQYECMFLPSQNALLTEDLISKLRPQKPTTIVYPNSTIPLKLYTSPATLYDTFVIVGIDTATMYGEDFYTITGVDFFTYEQLFEWHAKVSVDEVINVIEYVAKYIAPKSTFVIERNQGEHIIEFLLGKDYSFWSQKLMSFRDNKKRSKYGFWTDRKKKKYMFSILLSELQKNPNIVKSEELYRELLLVQAKTNGQIGVDPQYGHDDAVMAFAIALYVAISEEDTVMERYADEIVHLKKFKEQMNQVNAQEIDKELLSEIDSIIAKEKPTIQQAQYRFRELTNRQAYTEQYTRRNSDELLELMFDEQNTSPDSEKL